MSNHLYKVYRRGETAATSMDWAVQIGADGLLVRFGSTVKPAPLVEVPTVQCIDGDPQKEAEARTQEKLKSGYRWVGHGTYVRGRLVMRPGEAADDLGTQLFWEAKKPLEKKRLLKVIDKIATNLHQAEIPSRLAVTDGANGQGTVVSGLIVDTPDGDWAIGHNDGGGLSEAGRGGGVITRAQGTLPILVLLRIKREFPQALAFADENAEAVTPELAPTDPWLGNVAGPFEGTVAQAAALGLCPAARPLLSDDNEPRIWF